MKLRNKNTGEIVDLSEGFIKDTYNGEMIQLKPVAISNKEGYLFASLAELNEEWEDYTQPEPLIKDEKIRKAVRAWADANGYSLVRIGYRMASEPNNGNVQMHFVEPDIVDEDKLGVHTLTELCGEEEEC